MTNESAPRRAPTRPTLTVLVLTPLGEGGMGGIDRLMDEIRRRCAAAAPDIAVKFLTTRGPGSLIWAPLYTLAAALSLVRHRLTDGRCVCHANLASKGSTMRKLALTWLAVRLGHATVIHLHGALFHEYYRSVGPFQRRAIDRMYRESRCVIVLGNVWRDFVAETFGLTGSRILVLPNASAARPPREPEATPPEILFLGRLGARKGVPVLVAALGLLAKTDLAWRAEIAGDGDAAPYKAEVERLGLNTRVNFPGWLAEADAHRRLSRAAVLVLPSEAEGLPMAVIEAFAWGVPAVATPVGSIPDILEDGVQGLLMPVGDAPALAGALERLLADPALRQRLGANALDCFRSRLDFAPFMERLVGCWRAAAPRD
ncbi:MAG TPA: glycosyltransferase family 4 protein [Candidatus Binatia bacterium]|nr:glycosyltransferase family 4 protein [Candidatus Binatia bacterium]